MSGHITRPALLLGSFLGILLLLLVGVAGFLLQNATDAESHEMLKDSSLRILQESIHSSHPFVRSAAAKAMGDSNTESVIPWTFEAMSDDDATVRLFAVEAAAKFSQFLAGQVLEKGLRDPNFSVRLTTARVLDQYPGQNKSSLSAMASRDPEPLIRLMASAAKIGREGKTLPFNLLTQFEKFLLSESPQEKIVAANAMGKTKSPKVVPLLIKLSQDGDPLLRGISARAMGDSGQEATVSTLRSILQDGSPDVRSEALQAIGKIAPSDTMVIFETATQDPDGYVRLSAGLGLIQRGRVEYEEVVAASLGSPDFGLRSAAARSLGELHRKKAIVISDDLFSRLRRGLKDPSERVRSATSRALGMIGREEGLEWLSPLLKDPDPSVRCYAAGAILAILKRTTRK